MPPRDEISALPLTMPDPTPSTLRAVRLRGLAGRFLLLGVSCCVAVALGEGALRLAGHHVLRGGEQIMVGSIFNRLDPLLGVSLTPGARATLVSGGDYVMRIRIGGAGFRDVEHAAAAAPGVRRVLVLGDSFMFGHGVRLEETLARRLEGMLPGTEVINTGVPGYDLGQEYLYYKERGHAWRPDLVLLAAFVNDLFLYRELEVTDGPEGVPVAYSRRPDLVERDRERERSSSGVRSAIEGWMRSHSLLYALVRWRLEAPEPSPPGAGGAKKDPYLRYFLAEPDEATSIQWQRAHRILDSLSTLASSRGSRLVVVLIPGPWQTSDAVWKRWSLRNDVPEKDLSRWEPQERMMEWCARAGVPCLDLRETFRTEDVYRLYYRHDSHWTAEGHDLAARAVARFLKDHGLP